MIVLTTLIFALVLGISVAAYINRDTIFSAAAQHALENGRYERAKAYASHITDETQQLKYSERADYLLANELFASGDYEKSAELFRFLSGYEDSDEKYRCSVYEQAQELYCSGQAEQAAELFLSLDGYADSNEMYAKCRYEKADTLLSEGSKLDAALIFYSLGTYLDSEARSAALAVELTGEKDIASALNALNGLTPELLEHRQALADARALLPKGVIDTGFCHTVGIGYDGTVLACGDNSCGQCEVAGLSNAISVAAGAYHSAVLLADGRVIACGRNDEGQCDTAAWENIAAIAATDYATLGLRVDGSLVCTGMADMSRIAYINGAEAIRSGSYNAALLMPDGSVRQSHETAESEMLTGLCDIAVNTAYAVGLKPDGSVVCTSADLSRWRDVIAVSAGVNGIAAVFLDGHAEYTSFRSSGNIDTSLLSEIVAVSAGPEHIVFVDSAGAVCVLGDNSFGQAEVSGWNIRIS